jgi:hypothetical protein
MILSTDPEALRLVRQYWRGRLGREPEKARAALAQIAAEEKRIYRRRLTVARARRAGIAIDEAA